MKFEMDKSEIKKALSFFDNHSCSFKNEDGTFKDAGAIGGLYKYTFVPTSIGVAVSVSCQCSAEMNVTNFDNW